MLAPRILASKPAVEVVVIAPILVLLLMLVVAFGRYADRKGDVEAIARDAARAATLTRDIYQAQAAANDVVAAAESRLFAGTRCADPVISGTFAAGQSISVTVSCELPWAGLAPIGLNGTVNMNAVATSPLDQWRRTG